MYRKRVLLLLLTLKPLCTSTRKTMYVAVRARRSSGTPTQDMVTTQGEKEISCFISQKIVKEKVLSKYSLHLVKLFTSLWCPRVRR